MQLRIKTNYLRKWDDLTFKIIKWTLDININSIRIIREFKAAILSLKLKLRSKIISFYIRYTKL
jgi:hypothetical protein